MSYISDFKKKFCNPWDFQRRLQVLLGYLEAAAVFPVILSFPRLKVSGIRCLRWQCCVQGSASPLCVSALCPSKSACLFFQTSVPHVALLGQKTMCVVSSVGLLVCDHIPGECHTAHFFSRQKPPPETSEGCQHPEVPKAR